MIKCIECHTEMEFSHWQGKYMIYRCPNCGAWRSRGEDHAEDLYTKIVEKKENVRQIMERNVMSELHTAINNAYKKFEADKGGLVSANSLLLLAQELERWSKRCIATAYDGRSDLHKIEDLKRENPDTEIGDE